MGIGLAGNRAEVTLHAKAGASASSPGSNLDYNEALELILYRLSELGLSVEAIYVDSSVARSRPESERQLRLTYPIDLSSSIDVPRLRIRITEAQRTVVSNVGLGSRGGNKHKRIRLVVDAAHGSIPIEDLPAFVCSGETAGNWPAQEHLYLDPDQDPSVAKGRDVRFNAEAHKHARSTHNRLQKELSAHLRGHGITPRGKVDGEPPVDISWHSANGLVVAEVKSLTGSLRHQMRYGLGQVLDYRTRLRKLHVSTEVEAVLAVEFKPPDSYIDICDEVSVRVTWPSEWPNIMSLS